MKTKQQKIKYIVENTERGNQQNSWNNLYGFSKDVKIYSLPLTVEERNKAYELICAEGFYDELNFLIEDFSINNPHLKAGFNGRSGGHLVLYRNKTTLGSMEYYYTEEELNELSLEDLNGVYKDVVAFIQLYNDLLSELRFMTKNFNAVEEEYITTKTRTVLKEVD